MGLAGGGRRNTTATVILDIGCMLLTGRSE